MTADTPDTDDRVRTPRRFSVKSFALALGAILLADVLSYGLVVAVLFSQQHAQSKKDAQKTTDQFYLQCLGSNNSRAGLRIMVHIAFDNQGKPLDLTHIVGFDALDPATRSWVENVAKATAGSGTNMAQRDSILALFPNQDCAKKYPTHTRGLRLPEAPDTTVPTTTTAVP